MAYGRAVVGSGLAGACALVLASCYSTGDGIAPPRDAFYYPVGLAVSAGGNVLYVANADFDLQYNGGTLQSYDLNLIRAHTLRTINDPNDAALDDARVRPISNDPNRQCPNPSPDQKKTDNPDQRQPLGETCAPPMKSTFYFRDAVTIGAFATDLQLLTCEQPPAPRDVLSRLGPEVPCTEAGTRLFVPVRGNASLTWANVTRDSATAPPAPTPDAKFAPFHFDCGQDSNGRCNAGHQAGRADEPGNTRAVTMPGEPFGLALSQDGRHAVVTHQTETKSSLFATGVLGSADPSSSPTTTSLKFVLDGVDVGGNGVVAIPHDRALECDVGDPTCTTVSARPAFLQTSRSVNGIDLLRFYSDETLERPTLLRPFLTKEGVIPLVANSSGQDSRGIAIDRTPRLECKAKVRANPPGTPEELRKAIEDCAKIPARVYIANRTPSTLIFGELGATENGTYNPDRLRIFANIPLTLGPSRLYLAPIVDKDGKYALRLFIVCFDSAAIFVYDPDTDQVENVIRTSPGPFAVAFDPFDMEDVAARKVVPFDQRQPGTGLRNYRFAYVASFTNSFIQVIDLDDAQPKKETFERIVFTLGNPTVPKGAQ